MLNDEKLKSNSKYLLMLSLIIHNSSFIIYLRPPVKAFIKGGHGLQPMRISRQTMTAFGFCL
jgi:hypothetical protein